MKIHPSIVKAARREGAEWIARRLPTYCPGCGQNLEKSRGVMHDGARTRCIECASKIG